jgi:hypothetical protein
MMFVEDYSKLAEQEAALARTRLFSMREERR